MRASLLYNPFDLVERLAVASARRRRMRRLKGTPGAALALGHVDSLELLELLRSRPPATIYDIGANVGTWTCLAKSLYPGARVDAFEPLESHFEGFRKWTTAWPDIRLHACALGPAEGTATLEVMDYSDASSLLPATEAGRREFGIKPVERRTVPVAALDSLAKREALPLPDLIKLDVQGYELEVLRGGGECLGHACAVITEVSFVAFYERQPLFAEVVGFFNERGFRLHALGAGTHLGSPLVQADALFIKS